MRKYSAKEQYYIIKLVEGYNQHERFLALNLFDPILNGNGNRISINLKEGSLLFYEIHGNQAAWIDVDKSYQALGTSAFLEIESKVVELLVLIKDLADNRLIYFLDEGDSTMSDSIIFKVEGESYHVSKTLDNNLVKILTDCAYKPVLCLPELVSLKENGFVLDEERRHLELIEQYQKEIEANNRNHKETLEQKQKEMEQAQALNEKNIAAAEIRNKNSIDQQKQIADDNLAAAEKSNKTAKRIAVFSAVATGILSALVAQFIPMTIKHKQIDKMVDQLNAPIHKLESLVELYNNKGIDEKVDSIQLLLKDELDDVSTKLDEIIINNRKRSK